MKESKTLLLNGLVLLLGLSIGWFINSIYTQPKKEGGMKKIPTQPLRIKSNIKSNDKVEFSAFPPDFPCILKGYRTYPPNTILNDLQLPGFSTDQLLTSWWEVKEFDDFPRLFSDSVSKETIDRKAFSRFLNTRNRQSIELVSECLFKKGTQDYAFVKLKRFLNGEFLGFDILSMARNDGWQISPLPSLGLYNLLLHTTSNGFQYLATGTSSYLTNDFSEMDRKRIEKYRNNCMDDHNNFSLLSYKDLLEKLRYVGPKEDWKAFQKLFPKIKEKDIEVEKIVLTDEREKMIRDELKDFSIDHQDDIIEFIKLGNALSAAAKLKALGYENSLFGAVTKVNNWIGKERIKVTNNGEKVNTLSK